MLSCAALSNAVVMLSNIIMYTLFSDVAVMVLDRCTSIDPDFAKDSEYFNVTYSYDLIDDFRDPRKSESSADSHDDVDDVDDVNDVDDVDDVNDVEDYDFTDFTDFKEPSCLSESIFPKNGNFSTDWGPEGFDRTNHPLNLMVSQTTGYI